MEYYTKDELDFKQLKRSLLLSLAILLVTLLIDIAALLNQTLEGCKCMYQNMDIIKILTLVTIDIQIAIITFVVSNFIYSSLNHRDHFFTYLVWLFTILGFTALVILKMESNIIWLVVSLCLALATVCCVFGECLVIKKYIKINGKRLPF